MRLPYDTEMKYSRSQNGRDTFYYLFNFHEFISHIETNNKNKNRS